MGKRVKTDDLEYERACSVADYLQAVREGTHEGMRLGAIISALEAANPDARVEFDFGGFEPTGIDSYRGYYSDLAIGFGEHSGLNAGQLLRELQDANGKTFEGYKGGDYVMDTDTPVWVANHGRSHGVAIVAVEAQSWRVVLRTALID